VGKEKEGGPLFRAFREPFQFISKRRKKGNRDTSSKSSPLVLQPWPFQTELFFFRKRGGKYENFYAATQKGGRGRKEFLHNTKC